MGRDLLRKNKEPKKVWISCRSKAHCPGNEALVVFKRSMPKGGKTIRYRCTTCNGAFHISL